MNNRNLLLAVCREIEPLLEQLVLVGGCVTELLVSDPAAPNPRMKQDVDWVVNAVSLDSYYKLESQFTSGPEAFQNLVLRPDILKQSLF